MRQSDVTAIINGHREGLMASATLRSVDLAVAAARRKGLDVEILAVLDRPDDLTREIFGIWASDNAARIEEADFGDLGLSRNHGVSIARGKWIAFLDADDLWGENWLAAATAVAERETREVVWHPETNLYFGAKPHCYIHVDMDDPDFDIACLASTNPWTALCFASRKTLQTTPYDEIDLDAQIGYEDWGWHMATAARGVVHKIVPETVHAVRTKPVSLVSLTTAQHCLPRATSLFRDVLDRRRKLDQPSAKTTLREPN